MAAMGISGMFVLLMVLGGGLGPVSLPPMAEDAKLTAVAPEDCLLYVQLAGMAPADANSANHTERLIAEAQIQHLVQRIDEALMTAFKREIGDEREGAVVAQSLPLLIRTALTRPGVLYISKFAPPRDGPPVVEGAIVFNVGEQQAAVLNAVTMLNDLSRRERGDDGPPQAAAERQVNGATFRALDIPLPTPVEYGVVGEYLVFAMGEGVAEHCVAKLTNGGAAPAWLATLKQKLAVERTATITYVNVAAIMQMVMQDAPPEARAAMAAFGVDNITALASVTGLDSQGFVTRSKIGFDGEPRGMMSLVNAEPLTGADLRHIPAEANLAMALRLDLAEGLKQFQGAMETVDPRAAEEMAEGLAEFRQEVGIDLQALFSALGTAWTIYNTPEEGGLVFTGLVFAVDIRDHARVKEQVLKMQWLMEREFAQGNRWRGEPGSGHVRRGFTLEKMAAPGGEIVYLNMIGDDEMPFTPAWCVTESHVLFALYPQPLRAHLNRLASGEGKSLGDDPAIGKLIGGAGRPLAILHADTKSLVSSYYPLLYPLMTFVFAELQSEGVALNVGDLPDSSVVSRHLLPTRGVAQRTADGVIFESHGTLPLGGGSILANPLTMLFFLGVSARVDHATDAPLSAVAVAEAPFGGRADGQTMQQLKQLAIAAMTHAADHRGKLPDAAAALVTGRYLEDAGLLRDPQSGLRFFYFGNGKRIADFRDPAATPLFASPVPRRGMRFVAFVDGHVERVTENAFQKMVNNAGLELPRLEAAPALEAPKLVPPDAIERSIERELEIAPERSHELREIEPDEPGRPVDESTEVPGAVAPAETAISTERVAEPVRPVVVGRAELRPALVGVSGGGRGAASPFGVTSGEGAKLGGSFFGVGGNARKVVYVVDASGSLVDTMPFVIDELKRSISALSPRQSYTVIFFQAGEPIEVPPRGWKQAGADLQRSSLAWIDLKAGNVVPRGKTDPVAAIKLAMRYRPDLMFILSDRITGHGENEVNRADLLEYLDGANRDRRTKINTIQFLRPDPLKTLLEIAKEHGGVYKYVDGRSLGLE